MPEKATLTKEQADALETLKKSFAKADIIKALLEGIPYLTIYEHYFGILKRVKLDTIIRALYIGYEIEKTPGEKVKEYYEEQNNYKDFETQDIAPVAIRKTLDLLGITIEGVNDHAETSNQP